MGLGSFGCVHLSHGRQRTETPMLNCNDTKHKLLILLLNFIDNGIETCQLK